MHTPVLEKEIKRQYLFELYLHILLSLDVVGINTQYQCHVCECTLIAIDVSYINCVCTQPMC